VGVDVELTDQLRRGRVRSRDVVEAEVADRRLGAVVQGVTDTAVGVQHDQDVL
jgi:hypothetical protein